MKVLIGTVAKSYVYQGALTGGEKGKRKPLLVQNASWAVPKILGASRVPSTQAWLNYS